MKRILVVDDSSTIRKLINYILRKKDYHITEAEDGLDALEKLIDTKVDLVIADLNMPNMDGIELVRSLRNNYYHLDTPIIMLTTTRDENLRKSALEAGVNLFLNKPIQPNILLYKVESLLMGEKNE
ncbi:MAG TPA: response regulator [Syntrophorhabdaceae bacterium]|nr:response regulator [Syntrophorhabdaceae bacterium]HON85643.1 response regulator [Syntrophorhabdaceae bacterium]HOT41944.1 response regulator [Syntrophorhabdaceae bacterium]HPC67040.1 response regulator [Syntrophorhabdaceae bacterium]HPP06309.1 response regulator [Syntrophorhabdaceae bacterium]